MSHLNEIERDVAQLLTLGRKGRRAAMVLAVQAYRLITRVEAYRKAFQNLSKKISTREEAKHELALALLKLLRFYKAKSTASRLSGQIVALARRPESNRELRRDIEEKGIKASVAEAETTVRPARSRQEIHIYPNQNRRRLNERNTLR
jgi:hypothetical protein